MEGRSFQGAGFARGASRIRVYLLPRSGFALALLANLIWGTSFLASQVTLLVWGPFTASALRFAAAITGTPRTSGARSAHSSATVTRGLVVLLVSASEFGLLYPLQLAGLNDSIIAVGGDHADFILSCSCSRQAFCVRRSQQSCCDRPGHHRRRDPRQPEHFRGFVVVANHAPKTHGRIRAHPRRVVKPGAFGGGDPLSRPRSRFWSLTLVDVRGRSATPAARVLKSSP